MGLRAWCTRGRVGLLVGVCAILILTIVITSWSRRDYSPDDAAWFRNRRFVPAVDTRVRWVGRTLPIWERGGVMFDWPGVSAYVALFNATRLDVWVDDTTPWSTNFGVYVDGGLRYEPHERVNIVKTSRGVRSYTLISRPHGGRPRPDSALTVEILNLQEPEYTGARYEGNITILGFETDGVVLQAKPRERRLEIIGDSFTTGFGAARQGPCQGVMETNDYGVSYSRDACVELDADCSVVAYSGRGVYCSYSPNPDCGGATIPQRWGDTLGAIEYQYPWDFSKFIPQAVLINLGANDFCCGRPNNVTLNIRVNYEETYVQFVTRIAGVYGWHTNFFLLVGPQEGLHADSTQAVVARLREKGLLAHYVDLMAVEYRGPGGCLNHPMKEFHMKLSKVVVESIERVMGWS